MQDKINDKKRVLFFVTQSEMGGAQRFLLLVLKGLQGDSCEFKVVVGNTGDGSFTSAVKLLGIPIITLDSLHRSGSVLNDIRSVFAMRRIIRSFKPNTLFLNSSKAGFIGSLAARLVYQDHPKVIYRIGGWSFNDPWPKWKKSLWIILEKLSARWKDIIILNNKHDLDQAKRLGIKPKEKLILIYNGLDPYKLDFLSQDEARVKLFEKVSKISGKIFQTEYIVGTIANFYPTKGLNYLIEAASRIDRQGVVFFVIGGGDERPKLDALIKERGLEYKVFLIGQMADAFKYLPAFDIFVLPSVKEGFPWSVLEAMTAKLPVIGTRVGAVPEIIEDHKNGVLVEPRQPQQMADSIKELIANEHLRKELGIQAHQTVLFKFELDKMIGQVEELL